MRLILASASPRRAELLRAAGYEFDVVVADVDESIRDGESPALYVRRLAAEKSAAAMAALKGCATSASGGSVGTSASGGSVGTSASGGFVGTSASGGSVAQAFRPAHTIILGADTTVVVGGEILGKPRDTDESAAMLRRLAGNRHEVLTGVSVRRGSYELGRVETTAVYVRALSEDEIAWYVESGEGRDKAGGYAIQGLASRFILRLDGSYSNVVGLPVACVAELLRSLLASGP